MTEPAPAPSARVLFVGEFPPPNTGQAIATQRFYDLASDVLDVDRVDLVDPQRHERAPGAFAWGRARFLVRFALGLRRRLQASPVDVLYFTPSASTLGHLRDRLVLWAARPYAGRIVGHVHNGNWAELFDGRLARSARRLLAQVDTITFLSPSLARRADGHVPPGKQAVVANTISDAFLFSDEEVEAKIEARRGRDRLVVVFITNMIPSKGYGVLGDALIELARRGVPFEAHYVGGWPSPEARSAFEGRLAAGGVGEHVRIHGPIVDRDVIRAHFAAADVFALPTSYPHEAQPLSIIEALNSATPVLSTRHASIPDMVSDGEGGFLLPAEPGPFADALERLADPTAWERAARAARRDFSDRFDSRGAQKRFVTTLLGGDPAA